MLEKFDLLWINQTAGKIRLQEAWKAERDKNYPINQMRSKNTKDRGEQQRSVRMKTKKERGRTRQAEESFVRDTGKLWNQAPKNIKDTQSYSAVKTQISEPY